MKYIFSIITLAFASSMPSFGIELKTILANDSSVDYITRADEKADGSVSFDWSGAYFRTEFTGGYLEIRISDTRHNWYDVYIDGCYSSTFEVMSKDTTIVLANNISRIPHTIVVYKRSEGFQGITTVHSFSVREGAMLAQYPHRPKRKILYIGDSLTCGFGTESFDKNDKFDPAEENARKAFASITARYFDADYHLIAHSGEGVIKNYDDETPTSAYAMQQRIFTTYDCVKELMWEPSKFQPDLVVINLGTNDYSKKHVKVKDELFIEGYMALIRSVRQMHGNVPILNMSKRNEHVNVQIKKAMERMSDPQLKFVYASNDLIREKSDLGASSHPNYEGQKKMAMSIIPYIASWMNWELPSKPIE